MWLIRHHPPIKTQLPTVGNYFLPNASFFSTIFLVKYQAGYKYQLHEDYSCESVIRGFTINHGYFSLGADGRLLIRAGYAWDGASGPTHDDKTNMRGSLVHDAHYQMMRDGFVPQSFEPVVDSQFEAMCREDGMGFFRAWYYHKGVQWFGKSSCEPQPERIYEAP